MALIGTVVVCLLACVGYIFFVAAAPQDRPPRPVAQKQDAPATRDKNDAAA